MAIRLPIMTIFFALAVHVASVAITLPDDPFYEDEFAETLSVQSKFVEPDDSLNYADYRYLGTHNSHVYYRFFEVVNQQDRHIIWQLAQGARGLMLDTYDWNNLGWPNARRGSGSVVLSHGKPGSLGARIQKGHSSYQTLKWELRRIVEWMKLNPQAVVTIILEDYANKTKTAQEIKQVMAEADYNPLLRPADWPIASLTQPHVWPTLGWMRSNNKRLVIFTQIASTTDVTWNQFSYVVENQYSTTDDDELCEERTESRVLGFLPRQLVIFNNFSGIAVTERAGSIAWLASAQTIEQVTSTCEEEGLGHGRAFNGYFVNRIVDTTNILDERDTTTAFDYVNSLNAVAD